MKKKTKKSIDIEKLEKDTQEALKLAKKSFELSEQILERLNLDEKSKSKSKENSADKKTILDFLQKKSWDVRKNNSNIIDLRFEDDPPRIIVSTARDEEFNFEHNGKQLLTETEVNLNVMTSEEMEVLEIKEVTRPNSASAKNSKAYEDFLKRHKAVKIK